MPVAVLTGTIDRDRDHPLKTMLLLGCCHPAALDEVLPQDQHPPVELL